MTLYLEVWVVLPLIALGLGIGVMTGALIGYGMGLRDHKRD